MGELQVFPTGLAVLSAALEREAAAARPGTPPSSFGKFRSTASAIAAVHDEVTSLGQRISDRLTAMGQIVSDAQSAYDAQDHVAAAHIFDADRSIGESLE